MDDKENSTAEGHSPTAPLTMPRDYRRTLAEPPPLRLASTPSNLATLHVHPITLTLCARATAA